MPGTAKTETMGVHLPRLKHETIKVAIRSTAPVIIHKWSEKAKAEMLAKQMGKKHPKEFKNPEEQFKDSLYTLPDGRPGFPAVGFKAATVGAARYFDGVAMTELKRSLFFHGEGPDQLVRLSGDVQMREDMVKLNGKTADIRYRATIIDWTAELALTYLPSMLTLDSVIALVDAGGMGGIGEWRPEKAATGMYGTYQVIDQ